MDIQTTDTPEPDFVAQTLEWCNEQRTKKGEPTLDQLPKGQRSLGGSCPCGEATGLWVGTDEYWPNANTTRPGFRLPPSVRSFVRAFDGGELPQYDIDLAPEETN